MARRRLNSRLSSSGYASHDSDSEGYLSDSSSVTVRIRSFKIQGRQGHGHRKSPRCFGVYASTEDVVKYMEYERKLEAARTAERKKVNERINHKMNQPRIRGKYRKNNVSNGYHSDNDVSARKALNRGLRDASIVDSQNSYSDYEYTDYSSTKHAQHIRGNKDFQAKQNGYERLQYNDQFYNRPSTAFNFDAFGDQLSKHSRDKSQEFTPISDRSASKSQLRYGFSGLNNQESQYDPPSEPHERMISMLTAQIYDDFDESPHQSAQTNQYLPPDVPLAILASTNSNVKKEAGAHDVIPLSIHNATNSSGALGYRTRDVIYAQSSRERLTSESTHFESDPNVPYSSHAYMDPKDQLPRTEEHNSARVDPGLDSDYAIYVDVNSHSEDTASPSSPNDSAILYVRDIRNLLASGSRSNFVGSNPVVDHVFKTSSLTSECSPLTNTSSTYSDVFEEQEKQQSFVDETESKCHNIPNDYDYVLKPPNQVYVDDPLCGAGQRDTSIEPPISSEIVVDNISQKEDSVEDVGQNEDKFGDVDKNEDKVEDVGQNKDKVEDVHNQNGEIIEDGNKYTVQVQALDQNEEKESSTERDTELKPNDDNKQSCELPGNVLQEHCETATEPTMALEEKAKSLQVNVEQSKTLKKDVDKIEDTTLCVGHETNGETVLHVEVSSQVKTEQNCQQNGTKDQSCDASSENSVHSIDTSEGFDLDNDHNVELHTSTPRVEFVKGFRCFQAVLNPKENNKNDNQLSPIPTVDLGLTSDDLELNNKQSACEVSFVAIPEDILDSKNEIQSVANEGIVELEETSKELKKESPITYSLNDIDTSDKTHTVQDDSEDESSPCDDVDLETLQFCNNQLQAYLVTLPGGVDLTLSELQEMASRQQRQIDEQQQMLVAKEQRLKFLKQQEVRHQQIANENERLRKLREKVDAQELKLKKLRALRGHVNEQKTGNNSLNSELEQIKALFGEKEKELSLAVCKVEDLTRQLDELRNGRTQGKHVEHNNNSPAFIELDKLRKQLMIRNKLNEQQSSRIAAHREILSTRKLEVQQMDARIAELQSRLRNKKQLQLAKQANQNAPHNVNNNRYNNRNVDDKRVTEPLSQRNNMGNQQNIGHHYSDNNTKPQLQSQTSNTAVSQYGPNKQDTKYQTLPHNIKFPGQGDGSRTGQSNVGYSRGPTPTGSNLIPSRQPELPHGNVSSRNSSPRPIDTNMANFAPKPYSPSSKQLPVPHSVTSSTAAARASPAIVYGSNGTRVSSPKTSTPVAAPTNVPSKEGNNHMKEIFITGAPVVTSANDLQRLANHVPSVPSSTVQTTQRASPVYQMAGNKPTQPIANVSHVSKAQASSQPSVMSETQRGQAAGQKALPNRGAPQTVSSRSNDTKPSEPLPSHNTAQTTAQRQPPPYNYPHHRKPAANPPNHKSESTSSLPQPETKTEEVKTLNRQANSDSQLLSGSDPSVNSALSVLKSGVAAASAQAAQQNAAAQAGAGRPRFASRSAIANTYTNKLSSTALDQYRKNMSMMYADMSAEGAERAGSPTMKVQPMVYDPSTATSRNEQASPAPDAAPREGEAPSTAQTYPGHDQTHPPHADKLSNGPQTLPVGDIDKAAKARPNAPRPLRRRLSSGSDSPIAVARSVVEKNEARGMFYEEEQTSFSTQNDANQSPSPSGSQQSQSDTSPTPISQPPSGQPLDPPDLIRMDVIQKETVSDNINPNTGSNLDNIPYADEDSRSESSPVKVQNVTNKTPKGIFLRKGKVKQNVTFDPLALLLDAALEGELQLVVKSAHQVPDPSQPNDEGITALHNAICAGHFDIVKFLVEYGCNVNAPDSDGWTPLHCAASCNNLPMVRLLVENGACILATTISDEETAAEKCEEDEEGYRGCSEYLYSIQEKLGIANKGTVYAVFDYKAGRKDELSFENGQSLTVLRKGDKQEKHWWWAKRSKQEGYIPRNLLGMYPRVIPKWLSDINKKSK